MTRSELNQLQQTLKDRGVKYRIPGYVDMHGVPKTKMVPIAHLERMMGGSELFTGAALDGVPQYVSDEEIAAHPERSRRGLRRGPARPRRVRRRDLRCLGRVQALRVAELPEPRPRLGARSLPQVFLSPN